VFFLYLKKSERLVFSPPRTYYDILARGVSHWRARVYREAHHGQRYSSASAAPGAVLVAGGETGRGGVTAAVYVRSAFPTT